jgi:outer membrane usher protein FimD/PapC
LGGTNAWSLYGGGVAAKDYYPAEFGLGRDLLALGALSADVTQSVARFPGQDTRQGKPWRLSYSKRFDELNSEVTFAGYRFSEKNFISVSSFLDARERGFTPRQDKEL